jgi:hypothetical protein
LRGPTGLLILLKKTDDFKWIYTKDCDGEAMFEEMLDIMQNKEHWKLTINRVTSDYGSIFHTFGVDEQGRRYVTLRQPTQIDKVAEMFFDDRTKIPETFYLCLRNGLQLCRDSVLTRSVQRSICVA